MKLKEKASAKKIQRAWRRRKARVEKANKALAKAREAEELERKSREGLELRRREELERRRREEELAGKDLNGSRELRNSSVMKPIDKGEANRASSKNNAQGDDGLQLISQDEKEGKSGEEGKQQDEKAKKKKSKKHKKGIEREQLMRMGTNPLEALLALEQEGADFMGELYGSGKPRRRVMPKDSKTALELLNSIKF